MEGLNTRNEAWRAYQGSDSVEFWIFERKIGQVWAHSVEVKRVASARETLNSVWKAGSSVLKAHSSRYGKSVSGTRDFKDAMTPSTANVRKWSSARNPVELYFYTAMLSFLGLSCLGYMAFLLWLDASSFWQTKSGGSNFVEIQSWSNNQLVCLHHLLYSISDE